MDKMAQSPYRATLLHFFLRNAESIKFITQSLRSKETAQLWMPNKSFNADIWYSEITEKSLKQEEMERETI